MADTRIAPFIAMAVRTWTKVLRRPVVLVFSLAQPLMWMIFFGFLFHRYPVAGPQAPIAYRDFLLPGICAMTLLFGSSQAGVGLIKDVQSGFLRRLALTPASPAALLAGKVFADAARVLVQAGLVALAGLAVGARLRPAPWAALAAALALACLFAAAYGGLSCWLALKTRSQETMGVFIQAVNMPILFTSTALVPERHMPGWLASAAAWNPLSAVADALRYALLGAGAAPSWRAVAAMAIAACAILAAASLEMARARRA